MEFSLQKAYAPVAVFAYNRPQHLLKALNALKDNPEAEFTELFIFIDNHKNEADIEQVQMVKNLCKDTEWPGTKHLIHREKNYGLAKNIKEGIAELFKKHNEIIVIEDDILVSTGFLNYMNTALNKYKAKKEVYHINGFLPETRFSNFLSETFFSRFMNCWGWATWKDRWEKFNDDPSYLLNEIRRREDYSHFNFNGAANFENQLIENINGTINTWAIKWYGSIFINKGLCLTPGKSLVRNIGLDGTGVHYKTKSNLINSAHVENLAYDIEVKDIPIKESKLGRIYLSLFYAMGRTPKYINVLKYYVKYFLIKLRILNSF